MVNVLDFQSGDAVRVRHFALIKLNTMDRQIKGFKLIKNLTQFKDEERNKEWMSYRGESGNFSITKDFDKWSINPIKLAWDMDCDNRCNYIKLKCEGKSENINSLEDALELYNEYNLK